ncbi:MAG: galactose-1-epimerase, partial [Burkholderiaceae bacterium]
MSAAPRVFPLRAADGLSIEVTDIGAAWLSCQVPVGEGKREVLLGHPEPADVLTRPGYLGAVVGRY